MRRPGSQALGAAFVVVVTVLVAAAVGLGAVRNLATGRPVLVLIGVGMLLLVAVGLVLVSKEVRLGVASSRLARRLDQEQALPVDPPQVRRRASGRLSPEDAQAVFTLRREQVEAAPEDWRAWFRLAVAYGDAGDTTLGRKAMRTAVRLEAVQQ